MRNSPLSGPMQPKTAGNSKLDWSKQVPLVIDYYLGWNPDLQKIGRLLIAWVILECEHRSSTQKGNPNRHRPSLSDTTQYYDDWVRFIIHQIAIHCRESPDLLQNKVSFVTFNYDVSLETALSNSLGHIQMFSDSDVATFLGGSRIIHMYGKIRDVLSAEKVVIDWDVQNQDPTQFNYPRIDEYTSKMKKFFDFIYTASEGIRVIDPHDKGANDTEIASARGAIAEAKRVVFLGYGFDEHNSGRLNLREYLRHDAGVDKQIAFTNFHDINQINKRASKLFYGHPRGFPPGGPALADRYEKSTRNTYDALAFDFDLAD